MKTGAQTSQPITSFWIDDGRGLRKVERGNAEEIKVVEWQVRLYRGGQSPVGDNFWGLMSGKTAADVMRKLKKGQDWELRYNRWAGYGSVPDKVLTHFNAVGPIAKVERQPTAAEKQREALRLVPKSVSDSILKSLNAAKNSTMAIKTSLIF